MNQRAFPIELLEKQAEAQRDRLYQSVKDLQKSVRHRMDLNHLLQGHFVPTAVVAAITCLSLGYSFGSIFRRK